MTDAPSFVQRIRQRIRESPAGYNPDDLPEGYVRTVVDRMDRRPEYERIPEGFTHVSAAISGCARLHVLARRHNIDVRRAVTGGHRVMWAIGRAVEDHITDQFISGMEKRNIWARWACRCGDYHHTGLLPDQKPVCPVCRTPRANYTKVRVTDDEYKLSGEPDLLFIVNRRMAVTEIKSMTSKQFDELKAPKPDHVIQGAVYRDLMRRRGIPVTNRVAVFYATKDFKFGSPYKEYTIDVTQGQWPARVSEVFEFAEQVRDGQRIIPQRTICDRQDTGRAKTCPCARPCFSPT